jgi:hypothetical protein
MAKAFDTVCVKGILYKITVLNVQSYLVKTISSYLDCRIFQTFIQSATPTRRGMRAGVVHDGLVSLVLFSLYVNDIPTSSRHVELAHYADDTALVATSRSPLLLVGYLEAYLGRLEHWLRDWRIAINVSKSTAVFFVKAARCIRKPRAVQFLGEPIQWVETARYLGVTLDTLRKLQVLQSKCLLIATNASWYVGNRQVNEDLGIPFFADQIRAPTESFESKLADAGTPYFGNLEGTCTDQGLTKSSTGNRGRLMFSRPAEAVH